MHNRLLLRSGAKDRKKIFLRLYFQSLTNECWYFIKLSGCQCHLLSLVNVITDSSTKKPTNERKSCLLAFFTKEKRKIAKVLLTHNILSWSLRLANFRGFSAKCHGICTPNPVKVHKKIVQFLVYIFSCTFVGNVCFGVTLIPVTFPSKWGVFFCCFRRNRRRWEL